MKQLNNLLHKLLFSFKHPISSLHKQAPTKSPIKTDLNLVVMGDSSNAKNMELKEETQDKQKDPTLDQSHLWR
jgi:hypothetical protein